MLYFAMPIFDKSNTTGASTADRGLNQGILLVLEDMYTMIQFNTLTYV
jgi:hypothetical protein